MTHMRSRLRAVEMGGKRHDQGSFSTGIEAHGHKAERAGGQGRALDSRPCSKVTFMQPYGVLELHYYLGAMTMNGGKRWR